MIKRGAPGAHLFDVWSILAARHNFQGTTYLTSNIFPVSVRSPTVTR